MPRWEKFGVSVLAIGTAVMLSVSQMADGGTFGDWWWIHYAKTFLRIGY